MAVDLVIDIENTPGALARVAAAISDAGVNIAAATCIGPGERAERHILVPHAGAAKHALAISHLAVTREREVVVVDVEDRPGVLADLTRKIARAGVDLDLVYVATRNRVVFGAPDLDALKDALDAARVCATPSAQSDSPLTDGVLVGWLARHLLRNPTAGCQVTMDSVSGSDGTSMRSGGGASARCGRNLPSRP
jgi:hypothetical protein